MYERDVFAFDKAGPTGKRPMDEKGAYENSLIIDVCSLHREKMSWSSHR